MVAYKVNYVNMQHNHCHLPLIYICQHANDNIDMQHYDVNM